MKVRYRETDRTADVMMRHDKIEGLVLAGSGNLFYPDGGMVSDQEWTIGPDTFDEDWDLVEAGDAERVRLREAGFRV